MVFRTHFGERPLPVALCLIGVAEVDYQTDAQFLNGVIGIGGGQFLQGVAAKKATPADSLPL